MNKIRGLQSSARSFFAIALLALVAATSAVAGGTSPTSNDPNTPNGGKYAIGLWGDLPYTTATSDIQATIGVPNLIADMNSQKLAFSVHDGDLKAGSFPTCDDALYTRALGYLNALEAPAAFTPGDNDWTDCDRGPFNSLERLSHERQVLFSTPYTQGQRQLFQEVQSNPPCQGSASKIKGDLSGKFTEPCVENRRWTHQGVTYATFDVQGSCNNLCDVFPDPDEWAARNAANIQWLHDTFDEAKSLGSAAVMLIAQADPVFDAQSPTLSGTRNPSTLVETDGLPDGFKAWLTALRDEATGFRKPVAYVHGDSHYFRIDKPLLNSAGQRLENFTRVETFGDHQENGDNDVHWLKVLVEVNSREVFSYQPQIVPGNRTAVPAP